MVSTKARKRKAAARPFREDLEIEGILEAVERDEGAPYPRPYCGGDFMEHGHDVEGFSLYVARKRAGISRWTLARRLRGEFAETLAPLCPAIQCTSYLVRLIARWERCGTHNRDWKAPIDAAMAIARVVGVRLGDVVHCQARAEGDPEYRKAMGLRPKAAEVGK